MIGAIGRCNFSATYYTPSFNGFFVKHLFHLLAGLLLAVAQACIALGKEGADGPKAQAAVLRLAEHFQALYAAMDVKGLYDSKRK